jgi:hypothetical protein
MKVLEIIVEELQELVFAIRAVRGWKFVSSSVCMIYDSADEMRAGVRYIDFARAKINEMEE